MAAVALITFTQNSVTGTAGRAYVGATGLPVTVTNASNTDVASWKVELAYAPPGSALEVVPGTPTVLASANNNSPSALFTPDVPGSYRIVLTVYASSGQTGQNSVDIRNFVVPTANRGLIIPPYQKLPDPLPLPASGESDAKPEEMNYGGQPYGWAGNTSQPGLDQVLRSIDLGAQFHVRTPNVTSSTSVTAGYSPRLIPVDTQHASWAANSTVTLPSGAPVGHVLVLADIAGNALAENIIVLAPGGETINNIGGVTVGTNRGSATFVKISSTAWIIWGAKIMREELSIFSGVTTVDSLGFQTIGAVPFNPSLYPNPISFEFQALLQVTNAGDPGEIRLFNSTTSEVVDDTLASFSTTSPSLVSNEAPMAVGDNIYEAQIRLTVTGAPNRAACKMARLYVTWLQT